jgi:hypothetical protein
MKKKITNILVKIYASASFIALCPPEGEIKYVLAWLAFAIINFAIIVPHLLKHYLREDWKKLDSMDYKID